MTVWKRRWALLAMATLVQLLALSCTGLPSEQLPRIPVETETGGAPPLSVFANPTPPGSQAGLVAIIVDPQAYQALKAEVVQYAEDVSQDLGVEVVVGARDWRDPRTIRAYLQTLRDRGLVGAVLVGDIPATYFHAVLMGSSADRVPSDFYYMELDTDLALDAQDVFDRPAATTTLMPDIWVGRLKPPRSGQEGYLQLRDYFRRNHTYRTGGLDAVPKMLVLDDMGSEPGLQDEISFEGASIGSLVQRSGLYRPEDIVIPGFMSEPARGVGDVADALQTRYEFAYLNHHGTPTTQQCGQATLTSVDLERIHPKPLFYFIWSCSNGDFTSPDYIAGSYLFQGDGLVAFAATVPVLGNIESGIPYLYPLSLGATFGEAYQYANFLSPMALLGDPTLSVRQAPAIPPRLELEKATLEFGTVPVAAETDGAMPMIASAEGATQRIKVTNVGDAPLQFSPVPSFVHFLRDGKWDSSVGDPITFMLPGQIEPGDTGELTFGFSPTAGGDYSGFAAFYTNDPRTTLVVIPFSGTAQGDGHPADVPGEVVEPAGQDRQLPGRYGNECAGNAGILTLGGPARARPGEPVQITMNLSPSADLEGVARIILPEGLQIVGGEAEWAGALSASDALDRTITVAASSPGEYVISGQLEGQHGDGSVVTDCYSLLLVVQP